MQCNRRDVMFRKLRVLSDEQVYTGLHARASMLRICDESRNIDPVMGAYLHVQLCRIGCIMFAAGTQNRNKLGALCGVLHRAEDPPYCCSGAVCS